MRNALFAALMALATGIVAVPSAQAGGITITVDDGSGYYGQRDSRWQRYDRDDRRWNRAHRDDRGWGWQQRRSMRWDRDCRVKVVRDWRHNRVYMRKIRVCD